MAIHKARAELEALGILDPWSGLDQIREMAGEINLGIRSISKLSIEQRRGLIDRLIEMGAGVKNPIIYDSDRPAMSPRLRRSPKSSALAAQVNWRETDGYLRFCHRVIKAPPRSEKFQRSNHPPLGPRIAKRGLIVWHFGGVCF